MRTCERCEREAVTEIDNHHTCMKHLNVVAAIALQPVMAMLERFEDGGPDG